jgi:hypothetical protein
MKRVVQFALLVFCLVIPFVVVTSGRADDCCQPLATSDSPVRYFFGGSFAFQAPCPNISCYPRYASNFGQPSISTSYYTPGYYSRAYAAKNIAPPQNPTRVGPPWPYYYTPAGDYTPGYYSYYYTPLYFRD